jgi:hypothetical protein
MSDEYWAYARARRIGRPELWTTEPTVVDQVLAELQKLVPSARVASSDPVFEKLGIRMVTIDRLQDMDIQAPLAIVAILCKLGWEPLGRFEGGFQFRTTLGLPDP